MQSNLQHVTNRRLKVLASVDNHWRRQCHSPPMESRIKAHRSEPYCNKGPFRWTAVLWSFFSIGWNEKQGSLMERWVWKWRLKEIRMFSLRMNSKESDPPAFHSLSSPIHLPLPLLHPIALNQMAWFFFSPLRRPAKCFRLTPSFFSFSFSVFCLFLWELPSNVGRAESFSIMWWSPSFFPLPFLLWGLNVEQFTCQMILPHSAQDTLRENFVISWIEA